tara:strand:+ start:643 stop:1068 length:426 start_codon:yes stop_codon:yes gene_type:complete
MATDRAISGARCRFLLNGKEIGWATGVSATENIMQQPIDVLGRLDPMEIEATGRQISLQCSLVRILSSGIANQGGWATGDTDAVVEFSAMTAEIYDPITDQAIWRLEGLKPQTRSWSVDSRGVMTSNVSFVGLRMFDEQGN